MDKFVWKEYTGNRLWQEVIFVLCCVCVVFGFFFPAVVGVISVARKEYESQVTKQKQNRHQLMSSEKQQQQKKNTHGSC